MITPVWHSVLGLPDAKVGEDGDYAADILHRLIWGPKANGVWPSKEIRLSTGRDVDMDAELQRAALASQGKQFGSPASYIGQFDEKKFQAGMDAQLDAMDKQPQKSLVDMGVDELHNVLSQLEQTVGALERKLKRVAHDPAPEQGSNPTPTSPGEPKLVDSLGEVRGRLNDVAARAESLLHRLHL